MNIDGAGTDNDGDGNIDSNILGQAAPDSFRNGSLLPFHGFMQFDTADLANMETNGTLLSVIMHEMGHVLGIGTLWDNLGLIINAGTSDPRYTGDSGVAAYNAARGLYGFLSPATSVPVANTGGAGTADSHWRESVLNTELMTGFAESAPTPMPLSAITIGTLDDMGYSVRYDVADAFTAPAFEDRPLFLTGTFTSFSGRSSLVDPLSQPDSARSSGQRMHHGHATVRGAAFAESLGEMVESGQQEDDWLELVGRDTAGRQPFGGGPAIEQRETRLRVKSDGLIDSAHSHATHHEDLDQLFAQLGALGVNAGSFDEP